MMRLICCFSLLALSSFSAAFAQETYGNFTLAYTSQGISGSTEFSFPNGLLLANQHSLLTLSGGVADGSNTETVVTLDPDASILSYATFSDPSDEAEFFFEFASSPYLTTTEYGLNALVQPGFYTFSYAFLATTYDGVTTFDQSIQDPSLTVTVTSEPDPGSLLLGVPLYEELPEPLPLPPNSSVTPEPSSLVLLGTGLAGLASAGWRRRRSHL